MINKKIISLVVFISLFCLVGFGLAVEIENPLKAGGVTSFAKLLTKIVEEVAKVIVTLATIMIIVSGIFYLTSAGNPERMGVAKKALIYSIVGIVIGLAASTIVAIIEEIIGVT